MANHAKDPYALLGVPRTVSPTELRRAYRLGIVRSHRTRVLGIVEHLRELKRAYDSLRDPQRRAQVEHAHPVSARLADSESNERSHREAMLRERLTAELNQQSRRLSEEASRTNASMLVAIAAEHAARELAEQRRRKRQSTFDRWSRAVISVLLLLAGVVWLAFWRS